MFWQDLSGPEPARYDEVAAITHISPDDPPSFFYNPYSPGPPRDQASYVHHPKHQEALVRKLAAARVPVTARLAGDYRKKGLDPEQECRREFVQFVKRHLGPAAKR